jgi:hypothetical protein
VLVAIRGQKRKKYKKINILEKKLEENEKQEKIEDKKVKNIENF